MPRGKGSHNYAVYACILDQRIIEVEAADEREARALVKKRFDGMVIIDKVIKTHSLNSFWRKMDRLR